MKEIFLIFVSLVISLTSISVFFAGLCRLKDIGYRYAVNKYIRKKSSVEYWKLIQKYLDQQNINFEELCKKSRIDKSILFEMRNGVLEDISYKLLHKIAKILKINTNALIFDIDMKDLKELNPHIISDKSSFIISIEFMLEPLSNRSK